MRAVLLRLGEADFAPYTGAVVATTVRGGSDMSRILKKGHVLTPDDLPGLHALAAAQPDLRVPLLVLEPGDVHEDAAAVRLGVLLAGPGVEAHGPAQGKARFHAGTRGIVRVDEAALARLNAVPDVSVYTLFNNQPVDAGTVVAEAKCTPLVIAGTQLDAAAAATQPLTAGYRAVVDVLPFHPQRAALLVRERLDARARERVGAGLAHKLAWFGSVLLPDELGVLLVPDEAEAVADGLRAQLHAGATLILTAGSSLSDPFDATLAAMQTLGAEIVTRGVPAHPGSLLWIAYLGDVPIIGVPSCGLLSEATSFDLVLPRLLAQGRAALADLSLLAPGGLLGAGQDYRYPPYDKVNPQPPTPNP